MDHTIQITANNCGDVRGGGWSYSAKRNAVTGAYYENTKVSVGQNDTPNVFRGFLSFTIPEIPNIVSARIILFGETDYSTTDFNLIALTSTYGNPLSLTDYTLFDGHQTSGAYTGTVLNDAWNSSVYVDDGENTLTLNAAGLAALFAKKGDTVKIALISEEDYNESAPANPEWIHFYASAKPGFEPYLSLTYSTTSDFFQNVGGNLTPVGVLWRNMYITIGGSLTPIGSLKTDPCSTHVGGSLSFSGALGRTTKIGLGGDLSFMGELRGQNPNWLLIPDYYTWQGAWTATTYALGDAVLHVEGDRYFAYAAKAACTAADVPGTSPKWYRIQQDAWRKV